jgi:thiosulfate reductase cytochrome b subunit
MYIAVPLIIISGWALLFPEFIIDRILGMPGLTLTAVFHTSIGFLLSIFMIGHIYLATTGTTVLSNLKSMITGWHFKLPAEQIIRPDTQNINEVSNESGTNPVHEN